jgi:Fe2+ transport system protein FeoA
MLVTLDTLKKGENALIAEQLDPEDAINTMRIGLIPGQIVQVLAKIPGGPMVLRLGHAELAIGKDLSQRINVEATR